MAPEILTTWAWIFLFVSLIVRLLLSFKAFDRRVRRTLAVCATAGLSLLSKKSWSTNCISCDCESSGTISAPVSFAVSIFRIGCDWRSGASVVQWRTRSWRRTCCGYSRYCFSLVPVVVLPASVVRSGSVAVTRLPKDRRGKKPFDISGGGRRRREGYLCETIRATGSIRPRRRPVRFRARLFG